MKKIKQLVLISLLTIITLSISNKTYAHCEIPCGIYEDTLRIELIKEHIVTIEKSMKMIVKLSKEESPDYNQIVRWVNNKEAHANKLQEIVSQYFLHQRIKPTCKENKELYDKYIKQLSLLHELLVYSMKAKQTTDFMYIEKLNTTVNTFEKIYFHKHD
jgi:nickel superoxide dismutase